MRKDERLVAGKGGEFVRRGNEGALELGTELGADPRGEIRMRIQPGADRRPSDREPVEAGLRSADRVCGMFELGHVAGELLPERQRRRVLQVSAADLDDGVEGRALRL